MMLQGTPHATTPKFARMSRDLSDDRQTIFSCMSQSPKVGTPQMLWAATPTPGAGGADCYSFALPDQCNSFPRHASASDLSANAPVFVPQEELCVAGSAAGVCGIGANGRQQQRAELLLDSAEAQAVLMAESVLDQQVLGPLHEFDQQEAIAPLPCLLKQASNESSQVGSSSAVPTPPTSIKHATGEFLPSRGVAQHPKDCKPCAWMWKPRGCQNADFCEYCHLCPKDELKRRKKAKVSAIRLGVTPPSTTTWTSSTSVPLRSLKLFDLL